MLFISLAETERMDLRMTDVVPAMEEGYRLVGEGRSVAVPRGRLLHPVLPPGATGLGRPWKRDMRINPGGIEGIGYGINIGTTLVGAAPGSGAYLLAYFEWETMALKALIWDQLVHSIRSAAPDGVFARHLARPDASVLGLVGSGRIARWAVEAVCAVRPIRQVRVWSPAAEHRAAGAEHMEERLPAVRAVAVATPEAAVRDADVVVTATAALAPVIRGEWLASGCTVISNTPEELGRDCFARGRIVVGYREGVLTHVPPFEVGEALAARGGEPALVELGDVVVGREPGRRDDREIILCLNPAYGVHDAVLGRFVYQRAVALGMGVEISP